MHHTSDPYLIRPGRPSDIDRCAALNDAVHPYPGIADWTRDLFDGHPAVRHDDFLVAEPAGGGEIAATLVGIRQEWTFGGIRLPVVQVELVGTDPGHRGRGLAGLLFDALHARGTADGTALQVIEGIPYFYRRFGYEYALHIGGAPEAPAEALRALPPPSGTARPPLRPATPADAAALARVDRAVADRDVLACARDEAGWRHEISGHRQDSLARRVVLALLDEAGKVSGYLVHGRRPAPDGRLAVFAAGCADPDGWPRLAPEIQRHLAEVGTATAGPDRPFTALRLRLPATHPLAGALPQGPATRPWSWYARAGDPAALLDHWLPVLARRWREHDLRWPGDALLIDTYHQGIRLHFDDGVPVAARAEPRGAAPADTAIPPGALLQLLLGQRSPGELLDIWPDMTVSNPATAEFLEAGFPTVPPEMWAIA
ncbi:GNAT family N-acetyltransferase [Streptomyces hainanensis]|uniref:GNAT family N-acetyltransferase n=1 Tax=Streptomyces hainanensis TaxID=402648 RepID=UPI001A9CF07D|nr:GNAT family N-acetyltransferase [Streptomyces hainanensis]